MHRLQRFPDLALNPMERSETMPSAFYDLKNLSAGSWVLFRGGWSEASDSKAKKGKE